MGKQKKPISFPHRLLFNAVAQMPLAQAITILNTVENAELKVKTKKRDDKSYYFAIYSSKAARSNARIEGLLQDWGYSEHVHVYCYTANPIAPYLQRVPVGIIAVVGFLVGYGSTFGAIEGYVIVLLLALIGPFFIVFSYQYRRRIISKLFPPPQYPADIETLLIDKIKRALNIDEVEIDNSSHDTENAK